MKRLIVFSMIFELALLSVFVWISILNYNMYVMFSEECVDLGTCIAFDSLREGQHVIVNNYYASLESVVEKSGTEVYTYNLFVIDEDNQVSGIVELVINDNSNNNLILQLENLENNVDRSPQIDGYIVRLPNEKIITRGPSGIDIEDDKEVELRILVGECGINLVSFVIRIVIGVLFSVLFQLLCFVGVKKLKNEGIERSDNHSV